MSVQAPDLLTRLLLRVVQRQPFNRGPLRRRLAKFFEQRIHAPVETRFHGVPFEFNFDNPTEQKALFGHYNLTEVEFVIAAARQAVPVFVDVGANSGFFTQIFLFHATPQARALAIEPNPRMCQRIERNVRLIADRLREKSQVLNIENCAVGDQAAAMHLDLSAGFGAAHVVEAPTDNSIEVRIVPLVDIVTSHGLDHIDLLKIDVEGFEDRVLMPFFAAAPRTLFPRRIIIEHTSDGDWQGDLWGALEAAGYREETRTRGNLLLRLAE